MRGLRSEAPSHWTMCVCVCVLTLILTRRPPSPLSCTSCLPGSLTWVQLLLRCCPADPLAPPCAGEEEEGGGEGGPLCEVERGDSMSSENGVAVPESAVPEKWAVLELRPTQLSVGRQQVQHAARKKMAIPQKDPLAPANANKTKIYIYIYIQ